MFHRKVMDTHVDFKYVVFRLFGLEEKGILHAIVGH